MAPPPLPMPLSGRTGRIGPYGPIGGRQPITPPALAGAVPVPTTLHPQDDMEVEQVERGAGVPDNPVPISELMADLTETSMVTRRRVDVLRVTLGAQRLDELHEEQLSARLSQEYQAAVSIMESSLGLQAQQDLLRLEQQSQEYYRARWRSLEAQVHYEYSRMRTAQLDEVGRFESGLVNRFGQAEHLAYDQ
eukprot:3759975-Amphidinium_carterae.1